MSATFVRELRENLFRRLGHGAIDFARRPVAVDTEHAPLAALPDLVQRVGEQRKTPPVGVTGEDLDEAWLEDEASLLRGLLDDGAQPLADSGPSISRCDSMSAAKPWSLSSPRRSARMASTTVPRNTRRATSSKNRRTSSGIVVREGLLALVDDQHGLAVVVGNLGKRLQRPLARRGHGHTPAPSCEVRSDPGAHERGLAHA